MTRDPLERELEELELPEIPGQIRSRIGRAVEDDRNAPVTRTVWRDSFLQVATTGVAVAASMAIAVLVIHGHRGHSTDLPGRVALTGTGNFKSGQLDVRMTLALYMQAESKTGTTLDSMLDTDAAQPIGLTRSPMLRAASQSLDDLDP